MNIHQLNTMLLSFNVTRYHTLPTHTKQSVGDHTARMIAMAFYITNGAASYQLIRAILEHDALEIHTGDIPANAKWEGKIGELVTELENHFNKKLQFIAYSYLSKEEQTLLKIIDTLELCVWCSNEVYMGNKIMDGIFQRGIWVLSQLDIPAETLALINDLLGTSLAKTPATTPLPPH